MDGCHVPDVSNQRVQLYLSIIIIIYGLHEADSAQDILYKITLSSLCTVAFLTQRPAGLFKWPGSFLFLKDVNAFLFGLFHEWSQTPGHVHRDHPPSFPPTLSPRGRKE